MSSLKKNESKKSLKENEIKKRIKIAHLLIKRQKDSKQKRILLKPQYLLHHKDYFKQLEGIEFKYINERLPCIAYFFLSDLDCILLSGEGDGTLNSKDDLSFINAVFKAFSPFYCIESFFKDSPVNPYPSSWDYKKGKDFYWFYEKKSHREIFIKIKENSYECEFYLKENDEFSSPYKSLFNESMISPLSSEKRAFLESYFHTEEKQRHKIPFSDLQEAAAVKSFKLSIKDKIESYNFKFLVLGNLKNNYTFHEHNIIFEFDWSKKEFSLIYQFKKGIKIKDKKEYLDEKEYIYAKEGINSFFSKLGHIRSLIVLSKIIESYCKGEKTIRTKNICSFFDIPFKKAGLRFNESDQLKNSSFGNLLERLQGKRKTLNGKRFNLIEEPTNQNCLLNIFKELKENKEINYEKKQKLPFQELNKRL